MFIVNLIPSSNILWTIILFYFWGVKGGEISANFDLKNMILTYRKDFSWKKKVPKFARF
jgi:hypothetical protein